MFSNILDENILKMCIYRTFWMLFISPSHVVEWKIIFEKTIETCNMRIRIRMMNWIQNKWSSTWHLNRRFLAKRKKNIAINRRCSMRVIKTWFTVYRVFGVTHFPIVLNAVQRIERRKKTLMILWMQYTWKIEWLTS